jgi:DNA modification methylase
MKTNPTTATQKVFCGDNIELLKSYPDNYFDAVVTDPPYGLGKEPNAEEMLRARVTDGYLEVKGSGFMNKEWGAFIPQPIFWKEVFRVLKHGGHVVSFFGTRTYDWGVMAMRLSGFEIRDCIQWIYGSGFPKSHNISKAIDKLNGNETDNDGYIPNQKNNTHGKNWGGGNKTKVSVPIDDLAKKWDGWGSALKPAHEDLVLARKPFQFSSDFIYLYENIVYELKLQICQSKLFAKDVKKIFLLSQKESQKVELDFAQWSVGKPFNTKEDLLVLMDMLQLELKEGNTTLNIVLLWLNTLAELWNVANTYTTETESSTITELRILKSLEWESIFQNITLLKDNKINGLIANVLTVESLFSVLNLKLNDILTHSAKEGAILKENKKNFVPNSEQIVLARKPLEKGLSIAQNVLKYGTGGLNIDASRIGVEEMKFQKASSLGNGLNMDGGKAKEDYIGQDTQGRFPSNVIFTHSAECTCELYYKTSDSEEVEEEWTCVEDCPIKILDEQSGQLTSGKLNSNSYTKDRDNDSIFCGDGKFEHKGYLQDQGGASRFFYVAKASQSERNFGLNEFEEKQTLGGGGLTAEIKDDGSYDTASAGGKFGSVKAMQRNTHPTVKPVKLMQYLVRLITPENGIVLDPFNGSGTTGVACKIDGFNYVGMDLSDEYCAIAQARIDTFVEEKEFINDCKIFQSVKNELDGQTSIFDFLTD